jgi:uncharacterized membrane protein YczE
MVVSYLNRFARLIAGLFLYAVGIYLSVQASIGLAPWDAFSMGISLVTGISFGNVVVITGILIIGIDFFLREKIGFGTLLNAVLIGKFLDLIAWLDWIPQMKGFISGILLMILGQVVISLASYLYIGAAMGCGPRDALMVALMRRFPKVPVGLVRGILEGSVLLIGWLLGAKVGMGTVLAVFGIGFILQWTFHLLHFDVKSIQHENFADTIKAWKPAKIEVNSSPD